MGIDFERELLDYVLAMYRVRVMDSRGRPCRGLYVREGGKRVLPVLGGFLAGSAAYLALTSFEGNEFYGNEELLQLAFDAGERLVLDHAAVTCDTKPNHFHIYPLSRLYSLMGDCAGKSRLARWRDTMARNLQAVDALIDRVGDNLGKPDPWAGTGPNHYFGWFAVGHEQAQLLGDDRLARKIEKALLRHLAIQVPCGYFPERSGPATVYHHVSLGGVAEFHRQRPLPATRKAIERGVDFLVHALYPDLRGIETFDERNRLSEPPGFQHALLWTPAGRTLFARMLKTARQRMCRNPGDNRSTMKREPFATREWYAAGDAFRCYDHAVATRTLGVSSSLPIDQKTFAWKLEDKALVRRQGPWFHVLSAYLREAPQGNPYHMDRTQALSIYHDRTGLIAGGGNDKRAYQAATIHVLEGGDCHYFPPLTSKLLVSTVAAVLGGKGACDAMEFDYGSASARLEIRADSPAQLRVGATGTTTQTQPQIWLVLQLPVHPPLALDNGGRRLSLKKAAEGDVPEEYRLGRTLVSPAGWRMALPRGSTLLWPHIPWNPYRPPAYRETPDRAVALLQMPLHESNWRVEAVITVTAR